ncbi:DEAD/DEAH box helicase family protein [Neisseriaceae bacterium ESL0693]|nr:DEAD/DEAH box helicase family protein [Neisseriaceae bacterium ESL0693]
MQNPTQTPLQKLLAQFRDLTHSQRDKGTSFENLMVKYFQNEPSYKQQYAEVLSYADWTEKYGDELNIANKKDTGIDLVAVTFTGEYHAIQCKNFSPEHKVSKSDIDSFFTASGKSYFSYRIIVTTTNHWTVNADEALQNQQPPVMRIDLYHLENSVIDWSQYQENVTPVIREKKKLREHQQEAKKYVVSGLQNAERGKLIMACGTGKTFTALRIAEEMAGSGKRVLFLVPSLSLLGQTLNEWTQDSLIPLNSFAVCSDSDVGKKTDDDDRVITGISDLQFPATTKARSLCNELVKSETAHPNSMTVVFSTYHSIDVINQAQNFKGNPLGEFDLIICDEAHRTTGATFDGDNESAFVRVHNNDYIKTKKRLYMTATPRIYGTKAKNTENVTLCSMDDETLFGKELYVITFSEAVSRKLLVDYKVIVLAVEESHISKRLQDLLKNENNSLKVNDAAKIVGCWKALSKQGLFESGSDLAEPMKRAVAFCQVIEKEYKGRNHKVSSKLISEMFGAVVEQYQAAEREAILELNPDAVLDPALAMVCQAEHVDGGMNATEKETKLEWLKAELPDNTCRILSNVRCLSEGVDVPSLDAVLFLTPRNSEVDVVQSVGRVMRLAPNKKLGYVILPVVIPAGVEPEKALDDNQIYRVVWQVLNALRAHDDRFDAMINKLEFNGSDHKKMEVVAVAEKVVKKAKKQSKQGKNAGKARGHNTVGENTDDHAPSQIEMTFEVGEIERALYAKVVKKCGNRHHWEDWSNDIAKIAQTHIERIKVVLEDPNNIREIEAFNAFAVELRDDLNNSISDDEIIEMLAQHLITKPVFDALFDKYSFAEHNPMSKAMQTVLDILQEQHLEKERNTLQSFYDSVKMRAEGINSAEGKQKIVVELYDKFFRNAFPRMTERLGIVYTPVEVVDFIIHSVEHVLNTEFDKSMADKNVHILDPFTGTGTFITRLLQSGIIPKDKLPYKYQNEIHANEIVLLAYYIAAINIEATYHGILNNNIHGENDGVSDVEYQPFNGICLTDTFEMNEKEDLVDQLLEENSARRKRQKELPIKVIIGNPPYSAGQESENDGNKNVEYPKLDASIAKSYAAQSTATLQKNLYDSYVRAIRWCSNRLLKNDNYSGGVIGFVTNASFVDSNSMDGLRKCLTEEFSSLYVFHLRGNQRTSGERSRKEGGKIFGSGSRAPIAISILVKNPKAKQTGQIHFHDIGDYLSQAKKLEIIQEFGSIKGISDMKGWSNIKPDEFGDWVNQRDPNFDNYISLGDKKDKNSITIFENYSLGVVTNRDVWCYNYSCQKLASNMNRMINFYNEEERRYSSCNSKFIDIENFINNDSSKISWTRSIKRDLKNKKHHKFIREDLVISNYRPFTKQNMYFNRSWNEMVYQIPKIFPKKDNKNLVISITGKGATKDFSTLITNLIPDLEMISKGQCFPLYLYEKLDNPTGLFIEEEKQAEYQRCDAITDEALRHFQDTYPNCEIIKEDIFYYIYGLLHSEEYRERYADNLAKQLPCIPRMKTFEAFKAFSEAGRKLADLHLNYETVDIYTGVQLNSKIKPLNVTKQAVIGGVDADFRVTKMKFSKKGDKSTVIYNNNITIENIPEQAYDYVVNGKAALEWVMERQAVTTDKKSGITNDANDWAIETMGNAKYPLELFLRVITVSLETQKIVNALPKLDILN